jgi:membrane protein implicated in regulation of membrane protease activity
VNTETIWAIAGGGMIIADLLFGTFFILFTGAAALITALLIWTGILPQDPTWHWVSFAVLSTLGLLLFRKKLSSLFGKDGKETYDDHKGQIVVVKDTILAHSRGKVLYKGTEWYAKSENAVEIPAGTEVVITATEGITLIVKSV